MFSGDRVSIWEDENALAMKGENGSLMLLKCTLKNC